MRNTLIPLAASWALLGCPSGAGVGGGSCDDDTDCLRGQVCAEGRCVGPDAGVLPVADAALDVGGGDGSRRDAEVADGGPTDGPTPDAADGRVPDAGGDGGTDGPAVADEGLDGAAPDGARDAAPDGPLPDGPLPDGPLPDGPLPDGPLPDGPLPDGPLPDGPLPDGPLPDGPLPEPDMASPEPDMAPAEPDMAPPEPDMAPPEPDMAPPEPDMGSPPLKGYGQACAGAAECQSGICVNDPREPAGVCTTGCADNDGCPGLDVCQPVEGGGGVCVAPQTGEPCFDGADCLSGNCVTPPPGAAVPWLDPQPMCADLCTLDRHCPPAFRCAVTEVAGGGFVQACVPEVRLVSTCPQGNPAVCPGPCNDFCIVQDNGPGGGFCACDCRNTVDCPEGYACDKDLFSGDAQRPGVCLPLSGYRCPFEAQNPNIHQCLSSSCIRTDDRDESFCSSGCADNLDCPEGYQCAPFDANGSICYPPE